MKIIITGATGYIGTHLISLAALNCHEVVAISRRPVLNVPVCIHFDLMSPVPIVLPLRADCLIHLAANISVNTIEEMECEILAVRLLIAAAQKISTKFIFVSSQAARIDAPTLYGRTKWRIEQEVLAASGWVVRPGQVYGGLELGLFGTLVNFVRQLPLLPAFLPVPKVQPVHVDDLSEGLLRIAERNDISSGVLCIASPEAVSFARFLSVIASARVRRKRWFMPVPVILIQLVGRVLGRRLIIRKGLERLNSLFDLPFMNTSNDLHRIGLSLRSLQSGMHPSGDDRRRRMICEGRALMTYILKDRPSNSLVRRYVRSIEKLRGGLPLDLPFWAFKWPVTLALFDDRGISLSSERGAEIAWRLDAAAALSEATTSGAPRFMNLGKKTGPLMSLIHISISVLLDTFWRVLRIACAPFLRRIMSDPGVEQ